MNNKYNEAMGIFWGASFFLGVLAALITTIKGQIWIVSILIGVCVFLVAGLTVQGIITLIKKESK